jgi:hypothetical protein
VGASAGLDTEDRGKIISPLPGIEPRSPSEQYVYIYLIYNYMMFREMYILPSEVKMIN